MGMLKEVRFISLPPREFTASLVSAAFLYLKNTILFQILLPRTDNEVLFGLFCHRNKIDSLRLI
jgi:hypothetical protein